VSLVVLLGGARSGKSTLALRHAAALGAPVVFVATAEALDDEMEERIARHRAERPSGWATVEEPLDLSSALSGIDPAATCVVDCLSFWISNLVLRGDEGEAIERLARGVARAAAVRAGATIAVTNEVGLGVVPAAALGRAYRDLLGSVNRAWVETAEKAYLVVAGRALELAPAGSLS
jgi:adenosyl cobinamide kinase/adenosyl cobinamide phosphate guanylyltransferase